MSHINKILGTNWKKSIAILLVLPDTGKLFMHYINTTKQIAPAFSLYIFFGGLECVDHSFTYIAHLWFLRDVWFQTQCAAVARGRAINLATLPPYLATHPPNFSIAVFQKKPLFCAVCRYVGTASDNKKEQFKYRIMPLCRKNRTSRSINCRV